MVLLQRITSIIISLMAVGPFSLHAQADLRFFSGSLDALQRAAAQQQAPYLLYFYTDWSQPCQDMATNTFRNGRVAEYLAQHYLSYRIDAGQENRGGQAITDWGVLMFPTIIICSPNNEVLRRITGYLSADQLLKELNSAQAQLQSISAPPAQASETDTYAWTEPQAEPQSPSRFGVQVGVFGNRANAERLQKDMQANFQQEVILYEDRVNGRDLLRVMFGPFDNREAARDFLKRYEWEQGAKALIKDLSRL